MNPVKSPYGANKSRRNPPRGIHLVSAVDLDTNRTSLDAGEITLRCKGDRIERVYLNAEVVEQLRTWIGDRSDGPLFATRHGGRLTTRQVARRLGQWIEKAGIKRAASPHSLRHSFAMGLYARTHDVLLVKEALRHRSVASTLIYVRVDRERLRRAMERKGGTRPARDKLADSHLDWPG